MIREGGSDMKKDVKPKTLKKKLLNKSAKNDILTSITTFP